MASNNQEFRAASRKLLGRLLQNSNDTGSNFRFSTDEVDPPRPTSAPPHLENQFNASNLFAYPPGGFTDDNTDKNYSIQNASCIPPSSHPHGGCLILDMVKQHPFPKISESSELNESMTQNIHSGSGKKGDPQYSVPYANGMQKLTHSMLRNLGTPSLDFDNDPISRQFVASPISYLPTSKEATVPQLEKTDLPVLMYDGRSDQPYKQQSDTVISQSSCSTSHDTLASIQEEDSKMDRNSAYFQSQKSVGYSEGQRMHTKNHSNRKNQDRNFDRLRDRRQVINRTERLDGHGRCPQPQGNRRNAPASPKLNSKKAAYKNKPTRSSGGNSGQAASGTLTNSSPRQYQGFVYTVAKDQAGCRMLQKTLEEKDSKHMNVIFEEVLEHIVELMTDSFGNYLCQKLMEVCSAAQLEATIQRISGDLVTISLNMHGTRAVQKMIEMLQLPSHVKLVTMALKSSVVTLVKDLNGNHVVQKCLNKLKAEDCEFIYDAIVGHCVDVATHRHGCCVLQRCIDAANAEQKKRLIDEICLNSLQLVQDAFGNYVVQYILSLDNIDLNENITSKLLGMIPHLSRQKFSSNVVEKCFSVVSPEMRKALIEELLQGDGTTLQELVLDSFANYVVQKALFVAEGPEFLRMIDCISRSLQNAQLSPTKRRIITKLIKRYPQLTPQTPTMTCDNVGLSETAVGTAASNNSVASMPLPAAAPAYVGSMFGSPMTTCLPHGVPLSPVGMNSMSPQILASMMNHMSLVQGNPNFIGLGTPSLQPSIEMTSKDLYYQNMCNMRLVSQDPNLTMLQSSRGDQPYSHNMVHAPMLPVSSSYSPTFLSPDPMIPGSPLGVPCTYAGPMMSPIPAIALNIPISGTYPQHPSVPIDMTQTYYRPGIVGSDELFLG